MVINQQVLLYIGISLQTPGQQSSPGELESQSPPSQDSQEPLKETAEGWDNEDWGSLEEVNSPNMLLRHPPCVAI
jgi:hypothetical protein